MEEPSQAPMAKGLGRVSPILRREPTLGGGGGGVDRRGQPELNAVVLGKTCRGAARE